MNIISKLYKYQKERFPLQILIFTTISSVLASYAVAGENAGIKEIILVFFAGLFFIFHIRVIDESRDAEYDKKFYPNRPVTKGFISLKELFYADIIGIIFILVVALIYGKASIIIALAMFVFTLLAWKDFFIEKFLLDKPLLYHLVNSPQMIMLQLFIFAVFTRSFQMTKAMWLLAALVYLNIFILELIRKIKRPTVSGDAGDVYSKSLSFNGALIFTMILALISAVLFVFLLNDLQIENIIYFIVGFIIIAMFVVSILGHIIKKSKTTEKIMLLGGVILYIGLNMVVYFAS